MALFKNKETDKKRKGENVIGKIIYGFLLFAPLLSILFTSIYTVFNKNAFESYYGNTINQEEYVEIDATSLIPNNTYFYISSPFSYENVSSRVIYVSNVKNNNTAIECTEIRFYTNTSSNNNSLLFYNGGNYVTAINLNTNVTNVEFTFEGSQYAMDTLPTIYWNFYKVEYNKYSYLDNSFEYGMYKTEQSKIYNWSKSTGTYTVLQNVCTGIGITNTFVPMLMAYWLLISIIYFLFDIALILIWAVHDKIHALKDAI